MQNKPADNATAYIVIDTNVLISAGLLPKSTTALALEIAVTHFVIAQNQATWHELETRIAKPKFDRYFGDTGRLTHLVKIAQTIARFEQTATLAISRDATDDKFVGLAIDSGAKIILSGDQDLLVLKQVQDIEILTPARFCERYGDLKQLMAEHKALNIPRDDAWTNFEPLPSEKAQWQKD